MATPYEQIITEATKVTDPDRVSKIEDLMRNIIFHSTLDWQTRKQLSDGAREANLLIDIAKQEGVRI